MKNTKSTIFSINTRNHWLNTRIINFQKMKNLKIRTMDFIRKYDYYEQKELKVKEFNK